MLTSKQRAKLRAIASKTDPITQLGVSGITENFSDGVDKALTAREIVKISVLKNSPLTPVEAGEALADKLKAEFVAAIGGKVILYRFSKDKSDHIDIGK